ncbi:hypothetical protein FQN57_002685 [Myotisia sp. PD_48]|nr:hypothetical protein FQN57_002685 [Myotisia sp. PD_48]
MTSTGPTIGYRSLVTLHLGWLYGSFNIFIPVNVTDPQYPAKRVLFRVPLPTKQGRQIIQAIQRRNFVAKLQLISGCRNTVLQYRLLGFGFADGQSTARAFYTTKSGPTTASRALGNEGIPTHISRNQIYHTSDSYVLDLLACYSNRLRYQPNSICDDFDGRAQMAAVTMIRAAHSHCLQRSLRHGPFIFTLTDLHQKPSITNSMSYSILDQQRVFLAYRPLFEKKNSQIRKLKKIKQLLQSHKTPLTKSLGVEKIAVILQNLLESGVFSSELKAKLAFPVLFKTSIAQDEQHSASEAGAAACEEKAFQQVEDLEVENTKFKASEDKTGEQSNHKVEEESDLEEDYNPPKAQQKTQVLSLYPSYIPFRTQHILLTKTQELLEACCFEFTAKYSPASLLKYEWDCPEAIELNKWVVKMKKCLKSLPENTLDSTHTPNITTIFGAVVQLRHAAVHRLNVSSKRLENFALNAKNFATLLRDPIRECRLHELHIELVRIIKSQELTKNFLETQLRDQLDEICRLREELDRREQTAIANMLKEDEEVKSLTGCVLEESIVSVFEMKLEIGDNIGELSDLVKQEPKQVSSQQATWGKMEEPDTMEDCEETLISDED